MNTAKKSGNSDKMQRIQLTLILITMNRGIIRIQKQLLVIEAIANDVMLNDTEKIEQINESINEYYE